MNMKVMNRMIWSLLFSISFFACNAKADYNGKAGTEKEGKKGKKNKGAREEAASTAVAVIKKWEMPSILQEVSGIAWMGDNRFACVQDEAGVIFIYNTSTKKIEKQISFGAAGDYEGIALAGKTAYVVRSDGKIFGVNSLDSPQPEIKEYTTPLTAKNNVEGITYDRKNQRLLLVIKGAETGSRDFKGVYAFDLNTKKLVPEPIIKLNLSDAALSGFKGKNLNNAIQPSEIAVHPLTGLIYITEATNPQLFVLQPDGKIKSRFKLDGGAFSQPEGLAFSPEGDLFISNEGKTGYGNILQVQIDNL
jgi:uncharacterized protein YjiK